MKLATFETKSAHPRVGLVVGNGIVDVAHHIPHAPTDTLTLIANWADWRDELAGLAASNRHDLPMASVTLLAPVPRPGKILGIGLNYVDHVIESGMAPPPAQLWFAKMPTAANGPYAPIDLPLVSDALDYEAELAFVIGRRCRHVSRHDAPNFIFGYCAANDVTVRDWQFQTSQFFLGKSFDTHAPFGPWIVTADEVQDPHCLPIRCFVNGEQRQQSNTRNLVFDCFAQLEHLSKVMTLEPGDLILTGTPGGVGWGELPPRALRSGDRVRVEIEGIGTIENTVRRELQG